METSIEHLPPKKRDQLVALAKVIERLAPVEMIILFGSHARGDWVEDQKTGYFSDFDLMVVVDSPALAKQATFWNEVRAEIRPYTDGTPLTLLVEDVRQLNKDIRSGLYFVADVVNEGILLFNSGRFKLATPKAQKVGGRLNLALDNFNQWFRTASAFWCGSVYYGTQEKGCPAAFSLHQASERYLHCTLLVFTGYKPKSHDLEDLSAKAGEHHPLLVDALPRTTPADAHHFDKLKRAYIESRYTKTYSANADELMAMREMVLDLGRRVRQACIEEMRRMSPNGSLPELPELPDAEKALAAPPPPSDMSNPNAVKLWCDSIVQSSFTKGREEGEKLGREEGLEKGRELGREEGVQIGVERGREEGRLEERARSIVDVLRFRGLALSEAQEQRVLQCRDEATLTRWRANMFTVSSVDELEN